MSGGRLRRRLHTVARAAGWYAAVTSTAQVAAVVGVVAVDEIRKRRNPPPGGYASQPPVAVDVGGSGITTYTSGRDLYEAMLSAIEGAQHTIYFESYIWKADDVGQRFKDALVAASQRGVAVYVV